MECGGPPGREDSGLVERDSLCIACPEPDVVLHRGDDGFKEATASLFPTAENNALEAMLQLKARLRAASSAEFWPIVVEGLAKISGCQYAFVSKRILVDEQNAAIEMPPIGQEGSCLMGTAWYFNDGKGVIDNLRNVKYWAYGCPCSYMRHDKVFIVPERLGELVTNNPNKPILPLPLDAYIGVPLFADADGKCFAHFGLMWSAEGNIRRHLTWPFLEMLLHSFEDMIMARILEGESFPTPLAPAAKHPVIPYGAVTAAQSLQPYARSLSHELRTPMQGVVGMLDVMYATVQEAYEGQTNSEVRKVLQTLKENIEVVQDSSRRAVEAADNVVHAYDMNMEIPEDCSSCNEEDGELSNAASMNLPEKRPEILIADNNIAFSLRGAKRRRIDADDPVTHRWKHHAALHRLPGRSQARHGCGRDLHHKSPMGVSARTVQSQEGAENYKQTSRQGHDPSVTVPPFDSERIVVPGLRHSNIRDILQLIINESLKVGGRPESAIARETEHGEIIEVTNRTTSGDIRTKIIEWTVGNSVPDTILVDEKDLAKMISCVFLNAVKFTDEGRIALRAQLSPKSKYIVVNVKDTGPGIPTDFLPNLFKPFSREDDSLTRQSEGLGLGLLVAKGLSRKLGGDLYVVRADTTGPDRGCEFEMRIPITPGESHSRPASPFGSPTPSVRSRMSIDAEGQSYDRTSISKGSPPYLSNLSRIAETNGLGVPSGGFSRSSVGSQSESSPLRPSAYTVRSSTSTHGRRAQKSNIDRDLAKRYPLNFLVAEDNKINRKLLVNMLMKLGYNNIQEAFDGAEAVRQMSVERRKDQEIDVVLMDLWMPYMDGYEATERILDMFQSSKDGRKIPTILAVTADVTNGALEKAAKVGMKGFMTKPYKIVDLERLILEYCARKDT